MKVCYHLHAPENFFIPGRNSLEEKLEICNHTVWRIEIAPPLGMFDFVVSCFEMGFIQSTNLKRMFISSYCPNPKYYEIYNASQC
jgi:hypothetical protein